MEAKIESEVSDDEAMRLARLDARGNAAIDAIESEMLAMSIEIRELEAQIATVKARRIRAVAAIRKGEWWRFRALHPEGVEALCELSPAPGQVIADVMVEG